MKRLFQKLFPWAFTGKESLSLVAVYPPPPKRIENQFIDKVDAMNIEDLAESNLLCQASNQEIRDAYLQYAGTFGDDASYMNEAYCAQPSDPVEFKRFFKKLELLEKEYFLRGFSPLPPVFMIRLGGYGQKIEDLEAELAETGIPRRAWSFLFKEDDYIKQFLC